MELRVPYQNRKSRYDSGMNHTKYYFSKDPLLDATGLKPKVYTRNGSAPRRSYDPRRDSKNELTNLIIDLSCVVPF